LYLLDTNHCSRIVNSDPEILRRLVDLDDEVVSTDSDFRRMAQATDLNVESWLPPADTESGDDVPDPEESC
jgi:hypothetical protein